MRGKTKIFLKNLIVYLILFVVFLAAFNFKTLFFTVNLVGSNSAFKQTQIWQSRITREIVKFQNIDGRSLVGYIAKPRDNKKHPAILLYVPLARTESGDKFLNVAMDAFAQAGYIVLVPFTEKRHFGVVNISDASVAQTSFIYLYNLPKVIKERVGAIGVSYGAGPMIIAASQEPVRDKIKFMVTVGGYFDLKEAAKFATTGYYEYGKIKKQSQNVDDYARVIFSRSLIGFISNEQESKKLDEVFWKSVRGESIDISKEIDGLGPDSVAVWNFLANRDKGKFDFYYDALPQEIKEKVKEFYLGDHIKNLKPEIIFIHSTDDIAIPYTETVKLYDNFPDKERARLVLSNVFVHASLVDLNFKNFVKVYLPNAYRFLSAIKWTLEQ